MRSYLSCSGCGALVPPLDEMPLPFRCPYQKQGDDIDHVLTREREAWVRPERLIGHEPDPFLRYRKLLFSYQAAAEQGFLDSDFVALVQRLQEQVALVEGHGFSSTPFFRSEQLSHALGFSSRGGIWIKDETGNVSGSHKGRHLFGILLHLAVVEALGLERVSAPLAIASCGNAALAAAVLAKAASRPLEVFVPEDADPGVIARIQDLAARIHVCPRREGQSGDPAYLAFREAVSQGALPFSCQGPDNALTIQGGETLAYEMAFSEEPPLDRILVQVGGGALASSLIQGYEDALALGRIARIPHIHAVQTRAAFPLARAYDELVKRIQRTPSRSIENEILFAATHRSRFMWPWKTKPESVAYGILDDETYDWLSVVRGMLRTGGSPLVVDEDELLEARRLAVESTAVRVDPTGSAGLAGLLSLYRREPSARNERIGVLFTGIARS